MRHCRAACFYLGFLLFFKKKKKEEEEFYACICGSRRVRSVGTARRVISAEHAALSAAAGRGRDRSEAEEAPELGSVFGVCRERFSVPGVKPTHTQKPRPG